MSMQEIQLREFSFEKDYPRVLNLWGSIETGLTVGRSDTPEEIRKKIQRDPDLFLVADQGGRILGTVIGAFDGRRGMVYHLAVDKAFRRQGVGRMLLEEVERRLQAKGCLKCYLLVVADNLTAAQFYEENGWREMREDRIFAKEF